MKPVVWDSRKCHVGEGPVATRADHSKLYWVDILGNKVLWRDLISNESGEITTSENVSFVLPRTSGGLVLGNANGPDLLEISGVIKRLPGRLEADCAPDRVPIRWNDAKVGPGGEIWMGTKATAERDHAGLYQLSATGGEITRVLSRMQLSNGMDWSPDGQIFYLIDTVALRLYAFDYKNAGISNQRTVINFDSTFQQYPDGMSVDSEGCLWIAFWNGSCIRRYSPEFELLETVDFPVRFVSSCAFAGSDLKTLVVTTGIGDDGWHDEHAYAGMTFVIETDVTGKAPYLFGGELCG